MRRRPPDSEQSRRVPVDVPALFVATTALLFWLGSSAGWLGLPLRVIVASWCWSYAFQLVDHLAHGEAAPVLSIEMTNPWHDPKPLLGFVIAAGIATLVFSLFASGHTRIAAALAMTALAAAPASFAVLAIDGSALRALWPPALWRVAQGLGLRYVGIWLAAATGVAAAGYALSAWPALPGYAVATSAGLAVAALLGHAIYVRRDALGLDAVHSREIDAARVQREADSRRDARLLEAYGEVRAGHLPAAWRAIESALDHLPSDRDLRAVRERVAPWPAPELGDRVNGWLVSRLLALGRTHDAAREFATWSARGRRTLGLAPRDLDVLKSVAVATQDRELAAALAAADVAHDAAPSRMN